ncbi:MAG: 2-C-methyl-D-erythritol 4-phosphate cytidylyltransferase, partial [Pseudomonadota bacterium]
MGPFDAILLAAGSGTRYSRSEEQPNPTPKQFQLLEGKPVFVWALQSLLEQAPIRRVVIVASPTHLDLASSLLAHHFAKPKELEIHFISGGERRQDSSLNAITLIKELNPWPELVLIHDACRPFLGQTLTNALCSASQLKDFSGWIPGIPVTETLKQVSNGKVTKTVQRS